MKLKDKLSELEDFELAFIYKYRYDSFLEKTKNLIIRELESRNLKENQINSLINSRLEESKKKPAEDKVIRCPRCTTQKIFDYYIEVDDTSDSNVINSYVGKGITRKIKKKECIICGYSIPKKNSWWSIRRIFN